MSDGQRDRDGRTGGGRAVGRATDVVAVRPRGGVGVLREPVRARGAMRRGGAPAEVARPVRRACLVDDRSLASGGPRRASGGSGHVGQVGAVRPARPSRQRVLARPALWPPRPDGVLRRVLEGLVVVLVTAAVVIGLGLLLPAESDPPAQQAAGSVPVRMVTVGGERNLAELAHRLAPGADGPAQAALAEWLAAANGLSDAALRPGQVLRIPG